MHLIIFLLLFYINFGVIWSFEQSSGKIDSSLKSLDIKALCSNIDQPDRLMHSAISISHVLNRNIEQHYREQIGPSILVAIVTFASTNIWNYASYSSAINIAYAEAQGYMIKIFDENTFDDNSNGGDSRWNKIKIMEDALDPSAGWARNVDYLVWVDADLIFLDLEFKLETIVSAFSLNRNVNMFISAEHAGSSTLINSGCIMAKNSVWTRQFLHDWWTHGDRTLYSDQEQFDLLYEHRRRFALPQERTFTDNIAILPPDALNSDPPAMTKQNPRNKVLHLMGEQSAYRIRVFRTGLEEICRYNSVGKDLDLDISGLAHQLTLTQPNLLRWAAEEYATESTGLLSKYAEQLPDPDNRQGHLQSFPQTLETSRVLANSIHHYAYALVNLPKDTCDIHTEECSAPSTDIAVSSRYREAINLRKRVYQLMRRNLVVWKKLKLEGGPSNSGVSFEAIRRDWSELLKITSIAGQHMLSVVGDHVVSMREKRHVAGEILTMMQEMLQNSHEEQHDAILLMVADIHQQIGVLDMTQSYAEHSSNIDATPVSMKFVQAALQHFQLALDVTTAIAEKSGNHLLVAPLVLTANALSSLSEFTQAIAMYEQAVEINQRHLGPEHTSNIPLWVDYGISLLHSGNCAKSNSVFTLASSLLEAADIPVTAAEYQRTIEYRQKIAESCH